MAFVDMDHFCMAVLKLQDSIFGEPLVTALISFRGQDLFSREELQKLVASSGKFIHFVNLLTSAEGDADPSMEEMNVSLKNLAQMYKQRYARLQLPHRPELTFPLMWHSVVLKPIEFLRVCAGQGFLPDGCLDHLLL